MQEIVPSRSDRHLPVVQRSLSAYLLLDRSGSMSSNWTETVSALNAYVSDLAGKPETASAEVSLATFDTRDERFAYEVIRERVPASTYEPMKEREALPRGYTPLFDAIGRIVSMAETDDPEKAVIVIVTDGAENQSRELSRTDAKAALDRCRDKGWQVVFLGADFDAMNQGFSVGAGKDQVLNMKKGSYGSATRGLASSTALYASGSSGIRFSDEDRKRASGSAWGK